jgi:hypothetical protein
MQVFVSLVHSDNRVQKGQTHLDGHPAVSTEVRPAARFGDRRRDGRCACKGARALCSLDRNRGGHHLQTDTLREWQACRHVPVPCFRLFPTSSTRSETKAAGVGNYAISVSGDTGKTLAELSRSDKRRALAANRLIAQSSQNDPEQSHACLKSGHSRVAAKRGTATFIGGVRTTCRRNPTRRTNSINALLGSQAPGLVMASAPRQVAAQTPKPQPPNQTGGVRSTVCCPLTSGVGVAPRCRRAHSGPRVRVMQRR